MKLLILLLTLSGIVLASPRNRGPQVVQSGLPRVDQHSYYHGAPLNTRQDSSDPNTIWVKIDAKDLPRFEAQQAHSPSLSPNNVQNQASRPQAIPDVQFTVPSRPPQASNTKPKPVLSVRDPQVSQYRAVSQDTERRKRLQDALILSASRNILRQNSNSAQLISVQPELEPLSRRLPDNYSLIITDPVDNFRCNDRPYGYYADVENDCKIFHVCLPLQQLYPHNFTAPITYQFSFICNFETQFSQDSMTCAWRDEALPCELSPDLYFMNRNFGRKVTTEDGEERYAYVNEQVPATKRR